MQKTFVAIAFALALTCAFAAYTPSNFVKAPLVIVQDTDTNYTNMSSLFLASVTPGNVFLVSGNITANTGNASANSWNLWYKQLDTKALALTGNNLTSSFQAPVLVLYYNNWAFSWGNDNDTGIPQIRIYQVPVTGGAALPRLTLSTNMNASFTPASVGVVMISKTVYVFYQAAFQKCNVTNFQVGGSVGTPEFTLSTAFDTPLSLSVIWGEALGSSQVFAAWVENGVLKDAQVDISKGALVNPVTVGAYDKGYVCQAYATDKKWFGELCTQTNFTAGTINYYIRTNTTSLVPLFNSFTNTTTLNSVLPYGPYLALFYQDTVTTSGSTVNTYELWNLDTLTQFKNKTSFLTIQANSTYSPFRVQAGGLYALMYNNKAALNASVTNVQVGLLLGSSYLTTIFGFLLTIIAGLFLF